MGPSVGIDAGDHIWCSRYILEVILFISVFAVCVYLLDTAAEWSSSDKDLLLQI